MTRLAFAVAVAVVCMVVRAQAPVNCSSPLALEEVLDLLESEVPPGRVQQYVAKCGVSFELTSQTEKRIRAARGTDALVTAIREKAPKPTPAQVGSKVGNYRDNPKDGQRYMWIPP